MPMLLLLFLLLGLVWERGIRVQQLGKAVVSVCARNVIGRLAVLRLCILVCPGREQVAHKLEVAMVCGQLHWVRRDTEHEVGEGVGVEEGWRARVCVCVCVCLCVSVCVCVCVSVCV